MLSILVKNADSIEQLTVNITSNFPQYTAKITGIGRNNNKEIFVMSCNFMSCIFMSCNFMSCNFMPCKLVHQFHVLQLHAMQF